ncbi:MAG: nucleoside deaminase [Calditrichaeota bacterium]|nr:MAG: nucleoside deaminase [Calditrichota bacterium]MBL1207621.1 nucleoside deaminase [Calditrichota bacterium]NOG47454.1 nucleoside deaminase [Calditrichota bacterium]
MPISLTNKNDDQVFMQEAIKEARKAFDSGDVPVGAVVVLDNRIIGRGHNQVELLSDPTAHAEMIAITAATATIQEKFLREAQLFVTVEPCSMCAGASVLARIKKLVYGVQDIKTGAHSSLFNLLNDPRLNHQIEVIPGVLKKECSQLMGEFFLQLREKKTKKI